MGEVDVARQAPNVDRMRQARRDGRAGEIRRPHAARGDRRGDPRLGVGPRRHVLLARLGDRPAPVSGARARPAGRDRPRGARAVARGAAACRMRRSRASAAARNSIGLFHGFLADRGVALYGVEAGGRGTEARRPLGYAAPAASPACCTARTRCCSTTRTARSRRRTRCRPASTIPGVGPEHAFLQSIGRVEYVTASDDGGARGARASAARRRASCPRSRARMHSRARSAGPLRIAASGS